MAARLNKGLILLAHGSSDPRWAAPFEAIAARVATERPDAHVRVAYLERMQPDLFAAAASACAAGATELVIVPLFLAQGGHVRGDLPRLAASLRDRHPGISIVLTGAAGEAPAVQEALARFSLQGLEPPEVN